MMESLRIEKDAAVRAKEDLVAQVRILKKRLQEAEEEQYKAEEDAAALRAEIELLHHREESRSMISLPVESENFRSLEQELALVKIELQNTVQQLQQERHKLAIEQQHVAELVAERGQLQEALKIAQQGHVPADETSGEGASSSKETLVGKGTYNHQLRELASMVERLESGRQKLLAEIDDQSLEIERLFAENSSLTACVKDASSLTAQWERQVQQCLEQNALLRAELDQLRTAQSQLTNWSPSVEGKGFSDAGNNNPTEDLSTKTLDANENHKLKVELAQAKRQAETLNAQVLQLSANLNHATQQIFGLNWLYKPVLGNIESRLLQIKQQGELRMDVLQKV